MGDKPLFPILSESASPLFPIQSQVTPQASALQEPLTWLSNPSFSESLLPAESTPIPELYVGDIDDQQQPEDHVLRGDLNQVLLSPRDDLDKDNDDQREAERYFEVEGKRKKGKEKEHGHEHKKHKKKKKAKGHDAYDRHASSLGSILGNREARLVDIKTRDYYFDTRGDHDNLTYGSLYRMDVARFHRYQTRLLRSEIDKPLSPMLGLTCAEEDDATMDENTKTERRYWAPKYAALERRKDLKRLHMSSNLYELKTKKDVQVPFGDFIVISDSDNEQVETDGDHTLREESWDDYVIRKTKEFNQLTRERPHDESLWISFANFQDELVKEASRKAVAQQVLEKKMTILEKALEYHPTSEDLLLLYMDTCKKKDSAPTLAAKWENMIKRNPGSYKLWRAYLCFRRGEFSLFTVSSLRKLYIQALQAFSAAHIEKDQLDRRLGSDSGDELETEKCLMSLFVDLCRFEWQTGHHELAIGLLQAQVEYSIFAPSIKINERSKRRLFKEFWNSGAPRVGEDRATGWAAWLQNEEEQIKKFATENQADDDLVDEAETGGWTGWSEPLTTTAKPVDEVLPLSDNDVEDVEEIPDVEEVEDEKNEALLLERLGLKLDAGQDVEVKDGATWKRWSLEEHKRDASQWLPIRTTKAIDDELLPEADDDELLERAVLFEDIQECLFSLNTSEARFELICHFIDFCDGPDPQWCCSNSLKWKERVESIELLFGPLLEEVEKANKNEGSTLTGNVFRELIGGVEWMHENTERLIFLSNALLMFRPHFPNNYWLQEKILTVEGHKTVDDASVKTHTHGPRMLAKRLLKSDRQAILLWGAYAHLEATAGNMEVARKVFDTTLASLSSLPQELQVYAPNLYLSYADLELSHSLYSGKNGTSLIHQRVLHILSCLGCGIPYAAASLGSEVSRTQILKARHGFKQQLQEARKKRFQDLNDSLRALITCAALFELLTDGNSAASIVFEDSFAMSLPGKRQQSLQFELLYMKYVDLLQKDKHFIKPATLRSTILRALRQYPNNPQLLSAYICCSARLAYTNDLRRFFDDALKRNSSTVILLFAISIELRKAGSGPRIHSLFERALEAANTQQSVVLWRLYLAYELKVTGNTDAARRVFFRAIHACPWSKALWLDGFQKMSSLITAKELSELQDVMREKELRLRTDVYEILLEDEELQSES